MSIITEKHFLLKDYKNYADVFLKKIIIKSSKFKNIKYFINFISGKNLFYKSIYNLSAQKLEIL